MQEQIDAVQRMQDYIAAHWDEEIHLTHLSKVSYFSPWYSHRLFVKWLGLSPADYIRKLRLSKSALKLRDESIRITEVAFDMGFGSVDGYQRAFYREFGRNPGDYAAHPVPLYLFNPYGVKFSKPERSPTMDNVKHVFVQILEKPQRKVLIRRGVKATHYFEYCEEIGCDIWGLLLSMATAGSEPVSMWLSERDRKPGTSEYVQGVEVPLEYAGEVPEGFDVLELPATKYLMFQGEPFPEEEYCRAIDEVQDAIEKYNPKFIGYAWDPENPRIQLEPTGGRGYIELVAVKPLG